MAKTLMFIAIAVISGSLITTGNGLAHQHQLQHEQPEAHQERHENPVDTVEPVYAQHEAQYQVIEKQQQSQQTAYGDVWQDASSEPADELGAGYMYGADSHVNQPSSFDNYQQGQTQEYGGHMHSPQPDFQLEQHFLAVANGQSEAQQEGGAHKQHLSDADMQQAQVTFAPPNGVDKVSLPGWRQPASQETFLHQHSDHESQPINVQPGYDFQQAAVTELASALPTQGSEPVGTEFLATEADYLQHVQDSHLVDAEEAFPGQTQDSVDQEHQHQHQNAPIGTPSPQHTVTHAVYTAPDEKDSTGLQVTDAVQPLQSQGESVQPRFTEFEDTLTTAIEEAGASSGVLAQHSAPAQTQPSGELHGTTSQPEQQVKQMMQQHQLPGPLGSMSVPDVLAKLEKHEAQLFKNISERDTAAGTAGLQEMKQWLETALHVQPKVRRKLAAYATSAEVLGTQALMDTTEEAGMVAAAADMQQPPLASALVERHGTAVDKAGHALFQLSVLQSSGILPEHVEPSSTDALLNLHRASQAGTVEALLALADRFLQQGVAEPGNAELAMRYAKLAAQVVAVDLERDNRYTAPLAPLQLRERWMDGNYVAAADAENGAHVISFEEDLALRGNTDAQRRIAYRRLLGRGMEADPEGAFHDFQAAAAQGDPFAIFNLGYMYLRGLYVQQNHTKAREYFESAAEKGLPSGYNGLGVLYWNGHGLLQNMTAAFEAFQKGAAMNNSDSLFNLGVMYLNGLATERNETEAVRLFQAADEVGHWKAAYLIALSYEGGQGIQRNLTLAEKYFRKFFFERSDWITKLDKAAHMFDAGDTWGALVQYLLVAEQGSTHAAANVAWMLRKGLGYNGTDRHDMAYKWLRRAAKAGHIPSMVELAHMTYDSNKFNLTVSVNKSDALHWYQLAADQDDLEGIFYVAWCHQHGVGVEANLTAAKNWYRKAYMKAGRKNPRSMAPMLALVALWIDEQLQAFAGPHLVQRMLANLQVAVQELQASRWLHLPDSFQTPHHSQPQQAQPSGLWQKTQKVALRVYTALELDKVTRENVIMTTLLGALALALSIRFRQLTARRLS